MLIQFITSLPAFALLHTLSTKYTYYIIESLNKSHSHSQWRHNTHTHTHTQPHTYIFTLVYLQFSLEIRFEMLNKAFMRLIFMFMFIPEYYLFFCEFTLELFLKPIPVWHDKKVPKVQLNLLLNCILVWFWFPPFGFGSRSKGAA